MINPFDRLMADHYNFLAAGAAALAVARTRASLIAGEAATAVQVVRQINNYDFPK